MPPGNTEAVPMLRRPSQSYIDNYIARRPDAPASAARTSAPVDGPHSHSNKSKSMTRIFYALDRECPKQYYPEMHAISASTLRTVRCLILVLCTTQVALALAMFYLVSATHFLHDRLSELFTEAVAALCAFAACAGFVGVCSSSRAMLLFFYINQLWSLANVSTFAVINLSSADQSTAACRLFAEGELTRAQLADRGLDCDAVQRTSQYLSYGVALLLLQLWLSCFLAKAYSEMLQDADNDEQDRALVNFVWQRRGETWAKLEKFEEVVQRQFEELRFSLVAHSNRPTAASAATPTSRPPPSL